jgi:predicted dehydrogenase
MLKMAIIGMGKMAAEHARWIIENKDMELVAICEKNTSRHNEIKEKFSADVYGKVSDLISKVSLDFAVIATTNTSHEEIAIEVLNAGINVIVEKPMTLTYQSTKKMIDAAEKNNKHLFVHHSSRWDRDYLKVKDYIDSGMIGDPLVIQSKAIFCDEFWPSWGIEGMANPWRIKAKYGGGLLFDWGPHLVDQILQIMGKDPIEIYGFLQSGLWSKEVDDHFLALLKFENNIMAQIEVSNNGRISLPRWHVTGTRGTIMVTGNSEPFWDEVQLNYINEYGKKETVKTKLTGITESGLEGGFYSDLVPYLEGKISKFVSMYDSANVVKVLETIKKSSEEGKFLEFK